MHWTSCSCHLRRSPRRAGAAWRPSELPGVARRGPRGCTDRGGGDGCRFGGGPVG
jgi:hypothetical protein